MKVLRLNKLILRKFKGIKEFIPTNELEEELKRRNKKPELLPVEERDFTMLFETCKDVMTNYDLNGYSKDAEQYVYESAMEALYGTSVFDWINKNDVGC